MAVAILTIALAIFINSYSQIRSNSQGELVDPASGVKAQEYYDLFSTGTDPLSKGCTTSDAGVSYNCKVGCVSPEPASMNYVQRVYNDTGNGIHVLRVFSCS